MITLAAALNATLVVGASARAVPATAVLQQTGVPLQTQAVRAQTGLPHVFSGVTRLKTGHLCGLRQHLKYGGIHSFVQPVFDISLPGVNGLLSLAAHVVDVRAELPGPGQIDRHAHRQLLQTSAFLCQANGLRIFLSEAGHGLTGDDLIATETGDKAQGLVLVLSSLQLAQDQRSEYLHILFEVRHKSDQSAIPLLVLQRYNISLTVRLQHLLGDQSVREPDPDPQL